MASTLKNQGIGNNSSIADSITIELHSVSFPYNLVVSSKAILYTNGTAACSLPFVSGLHYIVVKHRNGLATWSAAPVMLGEAQTIYNFSDDANKAFGNNMIQIEPGKWAIYSGDLNFDENIDLIDASLLESSINLFQFGYYSTDLNGDGNVDLLDSPILEENVNNFIFSNHP